MMAPSQEEEEEAPEYPPPPAYFRMFAPPTHTHTHNKEEGDEEEGEEEGMGEEEVAESNNNFPLPPPAIPARGTPVSVFGFPLTFLDEEYYDPIVAPEARLYQRREVTVTDTDTDTDAHTDTHTRDQELGGKGKGKAHIIEVDVKKEMKTLTHTLTEKLCMLLDGLKTERKKEVDSNVALGEVAQVLDNMYDVMSAYRQQQTLLQMIERMEAAIKEKKSTIKQLQGEMAQAHAHAQEAEAKLHTDWTQLVEGK